MPNTLDRTGSSVRTDELIGQARALLGRITSYPTDMYSGGVEAAQAQVGEFFRQYAGPKSIYLKQSGLVSGAYPLAALIQLVNSYIEYLEAGLAEGVSAERRAQADVVSDILQQAHTMLDNNAFHPAAAAVLIGAALEEFLRNWIESAGISLGNAKPGIDVYCKALRSAELISKQDAKDITAWAGIRNHAAHGEWEDVGGRDRVRLMATGVDLFMRQHLSP